MAEDEHVRTDICRFGGHHRGQKMFGHLRGTRGDDNSRALFWPGPAGHMGGYGEDERDRAQQVEKIRDKLWSLKNNSISMWAQTPDIQRAMAESNGTLGLQFHKGRGACGYVVWECTMCDRATDFQYIDKDYFLDEPPRGLADYAQDYNIVRNSSNPAECLTLLILDIDKNPSGAGLCNFMQRRGNAWVGPPQPALQDHPRMVASGPEDGREWAEDGREWAGDGREWAQHAWASWYAWEPEDGREWAGDHDWADDRNHHAAGTTQEGPERAGNGVNIETMGGVMQELQRDD